MKTDSDRLKVSAVIECKRVIWSAAADRCARVRVRDALLMEEQLVSIPHSFLLSRCCSLGRRWIPGKVDFCKTNAIEVLHKRMEGFFLETV